jgi:hypothetical protein
MRHTPPLHRKPHEFFDSKPQRTLTALTDYQQTISAACRQLFSLFGKPRARYARLYCDDSSIVPTEGARRRPWPKPLASAAVTEAGRFGYGAIPSRFRVF